VEATEVRVKGKNKGAASGAEKTDLGKKDSENGEPLSAKTLGHGAEASLEWLRGKKRR